MAIYYLPTRPETVISIVRIGKLPNNLATWIEPKQLVCFNDFTSCMNACRTSMNQTFVLALQVPFRLSETMHHSFILKKVESNWIQKIIVVSEPAQSLLLRLFKNDCPKVITIKKNQIGKKRKHEEKNITNPKAPDSSENLQRPRKKTKIRQTLSQEEWDIAHSALDDENTLELKISDSIENSQQTYEKMETSRTLSQEEWNAAYNALGDPTITSLPAFDEETSAIGLQRLATLNEHIDLLHYALKTAKKTLLITSFDINAATFESASLYFHIHKARYRGVKIYIYCNDQKDIDTDILSFFNDEDVFFAQMYTHSKILAMDKTLVAVGSFNWLSAIDPRYPPNSQGSIVFRGAVCGPFIQKFWEHIKNYRSEQYGHFQTVERFERDPNNIMLSCTIGTTQTPEGSVGCTVTYLATLSAHRTYIRHVFENAQERIIVCSPFLSSTARFTDDLDPYVLSNAVSRGVQIIFICLSGDPYFEAFGGYLHSVSSEILLLGTNKFHHKTIICDEREIAEGSFNWLSAVRDRESNYHNHEATIVVEGQEAKPLIAHFFDSEVGQTLLQYFKDHHSMGDILSRNSQQTSQTSVFSSSSSLFASPKQSRNEEGNSQWTGSSPHTLHDDHTIYDEMPQHVLTESYIAFMNKIGL